METFSRTITGSLHKQRGQPAQDACSIIADQQEVILAVADGHGARECFRSRTGAQLAVILAGTLLGRFHDRIRQYHYDLEDEETARRQFSILKEEIIDSWNRYLLADLEENPITEEECRKAGTSRTLYKNNQYASLVYGTTLLCALLTENELLILQQGDGCAIFVDDQGRLSHPVPKDKLCIGHMTTSLCDSDARKRMRIYYQKLDQKPAALLLCTDGLQEAAATDNGLDIFCLDMLLESPENWPGLLEKQIRPAARDDMTIAMAADREIIRKLQKKLQLTRQVLFHEEQTAQSRQELDKAKQRREVLDREKEAYARRLAELEELESQILDEREQIYRKTEQLSSRYSRFVSQEKRLESHWKEQDLRLVQARMAMARLPETGREPIIENKRSKDQGDNDYEMSSVRRRK